MSARALLLLALLWSDLLAAAAGELQDVERRLTEAAVIRGEFQQTRQLAGFQHDLLSHGHFVVIRDRGAAWHTEAPFESTLVVTAEGLAVLDEHGRVGERLYTSADPGLRTLNETLMALLSGNFAPLSKRFAVTIELDGDVNWQLHLTPAAGLVAAQIHDIALAGDRFVTRVRLSDAHENRTEIELSEQSTSATPTPEEEALFAGAAP